MQEVDRTRRVAEVIRRELATLIAREISDPRIRNVSVNGVKISRDLKNATVFVSSLETPTRKQSKQSANAKEDHPAPGVEQLLNNASGYLRRLLSQHADLRVTPSLRFRYDDSIQRGVEMSSLIDELVKKDEAASNRDPEGDDHGA